MRMRIALLFLLCTNLAQAQLFLSCYVPRVMDGDTIIAQCSSGTLRVRLWGIDAPEKSQTPWGEQSRQYLSFLIDQKTVWLEVTGTDRYGRTVGRVYTAEGDAGLEMVSQGKDVVYRRYNSWWLYRDAQESAKTWKLGIWSEPGLQQDPAQWRQNQKR